MDNQFRYDPAEYHEQVARIAEHVVPSVDGVQTLAAPIAFESNSYHGAAIREAEQDRFDALYPRLRRCRGRGR